MQQRIIVIGSGVAGISAVEAILHKNPLTDLTLVSDDPHGYYSRPGLAYYLNRTIPEKQLFPRPGSSLPAFLPNRIQARVTQLLPEKREIVLNDGRQLRYDRLLLATGSRAAPGDFLGSDLQGIVTLYSLGDVRQILKLVKRTRTAVVIGGGIIALELAEGLAANKLEVHYFLRGDRFWSKVFDETESRLVERGLEKMGIQLHYQAQVTHSVSKDGMLTGVVTKTGETIPCQLLGVAVGVLPQIELAQQAGLAIDHGILVNDYLESSVEGVFAAGDVAQVCDSRTSESWLETLWPNARRQGCIAGANMMGDRQRCIRTPTLNTVRIGDIITSTIGIVERTGDASSFLFTSNDRKIWEICHQGGDVANSDRINRVRVIMVERSIVGAVVMGDQTIANPLLEMIQNKTDISSIYPLLLEQPELGVELIARFFKKVQHSYDCDQH